MRLGLFIVALVSPAVFGTVFSNLGGTHRLFLTFDACGPGEVDEELLDLLEKEKVPSTLFWTASWIRSHPEPARRLVGKALFEIQNHGRDHRPLASSRESFYGIHGAGGVAEMSNELFGGADAIEALGRPRPHLYRPAALGLGRLGARMAEEWAVPLIFCGVNGDFGGTASAEVVERNLRGSRGGDVVLMHMNRPSGGTFEGLRKALPRLRAAGFTFHRLSEALPARPWRFDPPEPASDNRRPSEFGSERVWCARR